MVIKFFVYLNSFCEIFIKFMKRLNILAIVFVTDLSAIKLDGSYKSSNMLVQLSSTCKTSLADGVWGRYSDIKQELV